MRRFALAVPILAVVASCVTSTSHPTVDCKGNSPYGTVLSPANPPPDSGSYINEGASYRKIERPQYPRSAIENAVTGIVYIHVCIQKNGSVSNAAIERVYPPSASALTEGLVSVVRAWKFNPIVRQSKPIVSEVTVPVKFTIAGHTPPPVPDSELQRQKSVQELETVIVEGHDLQENN